MHRLNLDRDLRTHPVGAAHHLLQLGRVVDCVHKEQVLPAGGGNRSVGLPADSALVVEVAGVLASAPTQAGYWYRDEREVEPMGAVLAEQQDVRVERLLAPRHVPQDRFRTLSRVGGEDVKCRG